MFKNKIFKRVAFFEWVVYNKEEEAKKYAGII